MELVFIILLSLLAWLNYSIHGKLMAPAVIFSALWAIVLALHGLFSVTLLKDLYPLHLNSLLVFSGGVLAFSTGSLFYFLWNNKPIVTNNSFASVNIPPLSFIFRLGLVIICGVALPFFIRNAIAIFIQSKVDNFLVGLRYELIVNDADLGPLKYLITVSIAVYALCQLEALRMPVFKNKLLAFLSFAIALLFAIFSSGRTFFLLLGTIFIGLQLILNPRFKIKKLLWIVPAIVVLFAGYGLLFGKGGNADQSKKEQVTTVSKYTALYLAGALNAQDYELNHQFEPRYNGYNSMRFFYVVGIAAGIINPVNFNDNLMQNYVMIPYEFNAYTFYSPYLKDFGYAYPMLVLFVLGLFQTWLYYKALTTRSARFALYYSIMLYPLVMCFFQDQYFSLLSTWIQCFVIIEVSFVVNLFFTKSTVIIEVPPQTLQTAK